MPRDPFHTLQTFGTGSMLFNCVDERTIRRLLGEAVRELAAA